MASLMDRIKQAVKDTPNDMMLGEKIRQMFNHEFVKTEMSHGERDHLKTWSNPDGSPTKEYLDYWTCSLCGKNTHEVDYDYLGSGTNHLECELKEATRIQKLKETKHFADGFHDGEWEKD